MQTTEIIALADKKEFIQELAQLHHSEWRHLSPSLTLEKRIDAISKAANPAGIPSIFIVVSGGKLLGSAALIEHDMDSKPDLTPWLAGVYVKKEFRHQGIAKKLVAYCEKEAMRSNVKYLYLYTQFASVLYESLGWLHMERCLYKGVVVDLMYKQLCD